MFEIAAIRGLEVLDSRGNPTIRAEVELRGGAVGVFFVPSGASTGTREALELRDQDKSRFAGKGVLKAIAHLEGEISGHVMGMDARDQAALDHALIALDATPNKSRLGANALLAVSCASAVAAARQSKLPLYRHLESLYLGVQKRDDRSVVMPMPLCNVLNGGRHAIGGLDIQEFQILPHGAGDFPQAIQMTAEIFARLGELLREKQLLTLVGDEGGYAPSLGSYRDALELMVAAIERAGYKPGAQVSLGLDVAASELYRDGAYEFTHEQQTYSTPQLLAEYKKLVTDYPLVSIEDPFSEDDWAGWTALTAEIGQNVEIIGDDLFTTNSEFIQKGITQKAATAVLIKLNQIGTLTETFAAMHLAQDNGLASVVSHRSGETEDSFIADLAVATGCGQIKTGSMSRSDRLAKYNRLLVIQDELRRAGTRFIYMK